MNTAIVHISDLHVTTYKHSDGKVNNRISSYLTTNLDEANSNHFIQGLITKIKSEFDNHNIVLVVSGDISDQGEKNEFTYATKFLQAIKTGLAIPNDRLLLLPGDHDIHRRSLENALDVKPNSESHLLHNVKFANFSIFYKEIKEIDFPFDKIIIDYLIVEGKIVLLGINSNYKIDAKGGDGFIPVDQFSKEITEIKEKLGSEEFQFVACWHHNLTAGYENKNSGQWDDDNRKQILAELERQNIKLILTGNEHIGDSKNIYGSILTSDAGALTTNSHDATFKVYTVICDEKIKLLNRTYAIQKTNGNDLSYFWDVRTNNASKQPEEFVLFEPNTQIIDEAVEIPELQEEAVQAVVDSGTIQKQRVFYENKAISDKLYTLIKQKQLFHSGHFHWSETSRAHNWIDVSKLLEDNSTLYFVQSAIIDIMDKHNLSENCDLIIGLGYEGNIIASKASIKYNIPYTSLPYSYRYNDHHNYEKKLNYENKNSDFKTVIVITDVVNDGRTIRKLIDKREKEFFDNVEKVIVLSLFYTGHQEINSDILNFNKLPEDFDFENDHDVNNIEYFTVKSLRVEKCPFGNEYKEECLIYKDGLSCVHLFYAEDNIN